MLRKCFRAVQSASLLAASLVGLASTLPFAGDAQAQGCISSRNIAGGGLLGGGVFEDYVVADCNPGSVSLSAPDLLDTGPSARVRHTDHGGFKDKATGAKSDDFEIDEKSVYGMTAYSVPGLVLGGTLRLTPAVIYSNQTQRTRISNPTSYRADLDTLYYGGTVAWFYKTWAFGSQFFGLNSDVSTASGAVRKNYDLEGYSGETLIANTFGITNEISFTLGGSVLYSGYDSDGFTVGGAAGKIDVESVAGKLSGTLFMSKDLAGVGAFRPFMRASYRGVFDQDLEVTAAGTKFKFDQATNFGLYEFGFDVQNGKFSYGASGYTEWSADEKTIGARISASYSFQ